MNRIFLLIGVIAAISLVAGCGGSDDQSLTKAEFTKQADAICTTAIKKIQVGFGEATQNSTPGSNENAAATKFATEVVVPAYQEQIDGIRALEAPTGDEKQVDAMLAAMQQGLDEGKQQPLALIRTESFLTQGRRPAKAYGLKTCG
jgi:hypothetical protein